MTPADFTDKVQKIIDEHSHDPEACHSELDDLMESVLYEAGYGQGVDLIRQIERWYA